MREIPFFDTYRKPGMFSQGILDDSSGVNVHGGIPTLWMKLGMLVLNLVVWLDAAWRLAG
jgi:hypothetical protein